MRLPPAFAPFEQTPIWVNWKHTSRKIPLQYGGKYASTINPATWSTYPVAQSRYVPHPDNGGPVPTDPFARNALFRGVGFMHSTLTPVCTIDIDLKRADEWPADVAIQAKKMALTIYNECELCETSISGKGAHVFGTLTDPDLIALIANGRKFCKFIDVFASHGFLALTNNFTKHGRLIDLAPMITDLIALDPKSAAIRPHDDREPEYGSNTPVTIEYAIDLLSCIKHPLTYDEWFSAITAVHAVTGGSSQGLQIADAWSALGAKYADESNPVERRWDKLRGGDVGTLVNLAKGQGADITSIRLKHNAPDSAALAAALSMTFKKR